MSPPSMGAAKPGAPELIASGLGLPEGPTVMPDGSLVFVDSYRSQLTIIGRRPQATALRLYRRRAQFLRAGLRRRALCLPERRHDRALARRRNGRRLDPAGA